MQSFDIAVIGGGMTGLALACGLKDTGLRVAVLEHQAVDMPLSSDLPPALRVSAINLAAERLLRYCGAWDNLPAARIAPYSAMEVWEKDSFAHIEFQANDYDYERLGYIIENERIQQALWQAAEKQENIKLFSASRPDKIVWGENEAFITLQNGEHLSARLVVGADGANSWLRNQADIPLTFCDYGQSALVATVRTELSHENCARQVFTGKEILAFLPLYEENRCSIVWSATPEAALELQISDEHYFNQKLTIAFDSRLGLCQVESKRLVMPLAARYARSFAGHRLALVGDAAHTIHPLAGQGVNLGFMDVIGLISELKQLQKQGKDIGSHHSLRHYERSRKHDAVLMLAAMQSFRQLFDGVNPAKKLFRDIGLSLADRLPGVKPLFVHQATGLDKLPDWLN